LRPIILGSLCGFALLASLALAADLDVTVVTLAGDEQTGKLLALSETGCKLEQRAIPFTEIAEMCFAGADLSVAEPVFYLRNGDRLKAGIVSGDDAKFKLKSAALGEMELENKYVSAVVFPLKEGVPPEVLDGFLKAASAMKMCSCCPRRHARGFPGEVHRH